MDLIPDVILGFVGENCTREQFNMVELALRNRRDKSEEIAFEARFDPSSRRTGPRLETFVEARGISAR